MNRIDWARVERRPSNKEKNGEIGEQLVHWLLGGTRNAEADAFNSDLDQLDANGKTVEIKTQNRYGPKQYKGRELNGFSVHKPSCTGKYVTNFDKCMRVDRLIFVEYFPVQTWREEKFDTKIHDRLNIWECMDRNDIFSYIANGREMVAWQIDSMKLLHTEHNPELAAVLRGYSQSGKILDECNTT